MAEREKYLTNLYNFARNSSSVPVETMLKYIEEDLESFIKKYREEGKLLFIEETDIKKEYADFVDSIPSDENPYDKVNLTSIFVANMIQVYENDVFTETKKKWMHSFPLELNTYSKLKSFIETNTNTIEYLNYYKDFKVVLSKEWKKKNGWKLIIKRRGSSIDKIIDFFCEKIFFLGLETKQVIAHSQEYSPLDFLHHDILHFGEFGKEGLWYHYEKLKTFIATMKTILSPRDLEKVYFFLYLSLFEFFYNMKFSKLLFFEYDENWFYNFYEKLCRDFQNEDFYYGVMTSLTTEEELFGLLGKEFNMSIKKLIELKNEMITKDKEKIKDGLLPKGTDTFKEIVMKYVKSTVFLFMSFYSEYMKYPFIFNCSSDGTTQITRKLIEKLKEKSNKKSLTHYFTKKGGKKYRRKKRTHKNKKKSKKY